MNTKIILFLIICTITVSFVSATENAVNENAEDTIENPLVDVIAEDSITDNNPVETDYDAYKQSTYKNIKTDIKQYVAPKTIVLNSTNFEEYVTDTMFNDKVNSGDTIDIQGFLDGNFPISVNKPLNITSTTNDAYIGHDQRGNTADSESYILKFAILTEGSGTNISNLMFNNVHFYTENAHNIYINNITMTCNAMVGQGRGMISIRDGSSNVTINNSYFGTIGNGGHSLVVFHYAKNCIFENNTVEGHNMCGNLVYLTTYGGIEDSGQTDVEYGNVNNTIRYNVINGMDIDSSWAICYPLVYEGANNTFENNIILRPKRGIITQVNDYGTNVVNTTIKNIYMPYAEMDYITDETLNDYGVLDSEGIYILLNNTGRKSFIITAQNISTVINNYGATINALSPNIHTLISNITTDNYKFERLYAPNTTVIINHPVTIINSTVKELILHNASNVTNNYIISNENNTIISDNPTNETNIYNNYLISYNNENIKYGDYTISITNGTLTNNRPDLSNINVLTNDNYYTLFNEDYTLKEGITGTIMALENITNPVIINQPVNLITAANQFTNYSIFANLTYQLLYMNNSNVIMEDYFGHYTYYESKPSYKIIDGPIYLYNNITFVNGSQNSNVTNTIARNVHINTDNINIENSSFYGKIILNNSNNNNIENNQLFGNNSTINLVNSTNNVFKDNLIHNQDEYTIFLDEESTLNIIEDNNLETKRTDDENNTVKKGGIDTVFYTQENVVEHNMPYRNVSIVIDSDDEVVYNQDNNLTVTILYNDQPVTEGQVIGLFNGTQIFRENLTNGTITSTFKPYNVGSNDIKIWYVSPGDVYDTVGLYKKVLARTFNTTLTLEADTTKIGENITVKAVLKDEFNRTLDNQTVLFKIGEEEYSFTTVDGVVLLNATTNETWYSSGVQAIFYSTGSYNQSISNKIRLEKGEVLFDSKQKIMDDKLVVTVKVTDVNGVPVTTGRVRFRGNFTGNPQVTDGIAVLEIPVANVTEGMTVTANFTTTAFNQKIETITLTLNPPVITTISVGEVTGKVNEETTITAMIMVEGGMLVSEGRVTFTTSDYEETVNVENGVASVTHIFSHTLEDTIHVTYIPIDTSAYYPSTNTTTITITKDSENTNVTIENITGKVNKETIITAQVSTVNGVPVNGGTVTFVADCYSETVDVIDGVATTMHIFTEAFNGTLQAIFAPANPEDYNPSTATATITVTGVVYSLRVDTKTFTLNQPNMIKATIYADEGIATNITKGKVVFKVDGKTLKDSGGKVIYAKVINGTAMIENYTVPDSWNNQTVIQAVYSGSGDLQSLKSDREEIAIALPQPTVTLDDYTAQRGETIRINVNVMQQQTPLSVGKVVLKINGKTLKDSGGKVIYACVDNGLATVDYTIPESMKTKEYVITAVFIANGYERVEKTSKLTIVE